jgi:hypothetical protein
MTFGDEHAPDAIEPITAYRVWLVAPDGTLSSFSRETMWPPGGWLEARCLRGRHDAPRERCGCGVYGAKDLNYVLTMAVQALPEFAARIGMELPDPIPGEKPRPVPVLGRVHLAGRIIEHDFGYRAELASLAEILPLPGFDQWTDVVAGLYGVPVGDPISRDAIDAGLQHAVDDWHRIRALLHPNHEQTQEEPSPMLSLLVLATSVFFLVNAIRGILMDDGPHWSEWWLWFIALGAIGVAACSLAIVLPAIAGFRLWESRSSDSPAGGRPRPPRPY